MSVPLWPKRHKKVKDTGGISKEGAIFFEALWEATQSTEAEECWSLSPGQPRLHGQ